MTAATNTSLTLPSVALAARAGGRRARDRTCRGGGRARGRASRATSARSRARRCARSSAAVRPKSAPACSGSRSVATRRVRARSRARDARRRASGATSAPASRASSDRESIDSGAGTAGVSSGSAASAVRSTSKREQRHAADAVGHRVVHLHRERGALGAVGVVETFDQRELPQRPGAVEAGRGHRLQRVEERALGARRGEPHAAQVEVEVEGRLDRPARRSEPERRRLHALAEARDQARRAVDARAQPVEVGRPVEQRDRDDRRAQDRVLLDEPHERVLVAHVPCEAGTCGELSAI